MNRSQVTHAVVSAVKALSVLVGLSAYSSLIPHQYLLVALVVFGVASTVKDLLSSLEKRLESNEPLPEVALDTVKDVVDAAKSFQSPKK